MLAKDLRAKSFQELKSLAVELRAQLFQLQFKNATGQQKQTHKIRLIRRDIARILTCLAEKKEQRSKVMVLKSEIKTEAIKKGAK